MQNEIDKRINKFISFSALTIGCMVKLSCQTSTEVNDYSFENELKAGSPQPTVSSFKKLDSLMGMTCKV
ncbi:MAG TPA: hypothetical protein DHV28_16175 [Ignavibacteriales bacterium]|nr:hypothetical protein [Ignavibacteriales bacterium]